MKSLLLVCCGLVATLLAPLTVGATTLPPGFVETKVLPSASFDSPMGMAFAPDGRLFILEQTGQILIYTDGNLLPTPFLSISVAYGGELGLKAIAFDPDFATNGYVYVHYTATVPVNHNRISRFTASGNSVVAGSEVVLLDMDQSYGGGHNGGFLGFGADGKLYATTGEDYHGPHSQEMNSTLGKMLRINKDGTIPTDNPFYSTTTGIYRSIWALGLRNPYSAAIQIGTGRIYVNDVGFSTWEEINEITPGYNYGWPTLEGADTVSPPRFVDPVYAYRHPPLSEKNGSAAITGGTFYNPNTRQFPSVYEGKYFFLDFVSNWIAYLDPTSPGNGPTTFATDIAPSPIYLTTAPDGSLYYIAHDEGSLFRVSYTGILSPQFGLHPRSQLISADHPVTFSVSASGGPPLTYAWHRDGAPIPGATESSYTIPSVALSDHGAQFYCVATNPSGSATSETAILSVTSDRPPVASIASPAAGTDPNVALQTYAAGDVISFSGSAEDPETGALPASMLTWQIDFHHHEHLHPAMPPTSGISSGTYTIPIIGETEDNVWYRVLLMATDSAGLTHVTYRDIHPKKAQITLASNPSGLHLELDGTPRTAPASATGVVGVVREIAAPSPQQLNGKIYEFASWSDGLAAAHEILTPAENTTYTATFREVQPVNSSAFISQSVATSVIAGQRQGVSVTMKNTGNTTWKVGSNSRLGSQRPQDNYVWGLSRVPVPYDVLPGALVTFNFDVKAPEVAGTYDFQWRMVQDGVAWFGETTPNVRVSSTVQQRAAYFVSQQVPTTMNAGQSYPVTVVMKNVGTATWSEADLYRLGPLAPMDNPAWGVKRAFLSSSVAPGQKATFNFTVQAPTTPGTYNFQWSMVRDGITWFGDASPLTFIQVATPANAASFVSQATTPTSLTAGQQYAFWVTMKNTGTASWTSDTGYALGSKNPQDNKSWGFNRVALPASVAPGASVTFNFTITAPATIGTYNLQWQMVRTGVAWFGGLTENRSISVTGAPQNDAKFVSQSVPSTMVAGASYTVSIQLTNTGSKTWSDKELYRLGSESPMDNVIWGGNRVPVGQTIASGATATISFKVIAPSEAGNYGFQWRMIQDRGVGWFGEPSAKLSIDVQSAPVATSMSLTTTSKPSRTTRTRK